MNCLKMSEEKEDQDVPVNTRTIRRPQRYAEIRKVNGNDAFPEVLHRVKGKFHYDRGDPLCNTGPSCVSCVDREGEKGLKG